MKVIILLFAAFCLDAFASDHHCPIFNKTYSDSQIMMNESAPKMLVRDIKKMKVWPKEDLLIFEGWDKGADYIKMRCS